MREVTITNKLISLMKMALQNTQNLLRIQCNQNNERPKVRKFSVHIAIRSITRKNNKVQRNKYDMMKLKLIQMT